MLQRIIGSLDYSSWDRGLSPYYKLENDKLVRQGTFRDHFFVYWFYRPIVSIRNTPLQIEPQLFVSLKNKLEIAGITVISLPERVHVAEELLIPNKDYHPNGRGNLVMAQIYIDALKKINVLPL